ncbi:MAG: DUF4325 domain-containing protein [Candidatus Omnitrophota bacterium]
MEIKKMILNILNKKSQIKVADITAITGFSRAYINRFFQELRDQGKIVLMGKANNAHYIKSTESAIKKAKQLQKKVVRVLKNENLFEHEVLKSIKNTSEILENLKNNILSIVDYSFTEMLNNAIDHSESEQIKVIMEKDAEGICFSVIDKGIGIFENIQKKHNLKNHMEAIENLLKGKQTTAPKAHSGEGIFFTSKAADTFSIKSAEKKIVFNNIIDDIFIRNVRKTQGTRIDFFIRKESSRKLEEIFRKFTDDLFSFSKTKINVRLYKMGTDYISRSQAKRILVGLNKFQTIVLDFRNVHSVGQGFADEVFRVWQQKYPNIKIITDNTNENIKFMINRAKNGGGL